VVTKPREIFDAQNISPLRLKLASTWYLRANKVVSNDISQSELLACPTFVIAHRAVCVLVDRKVNRRAAVHKTLPFLGNYVVDSVYSSQVDVDVKTE
jgi:hypothetical protein